MFVLIVNDFGIEYVGEQHAKHLQKVVQEHYTITTNWEGKKLAGIDIEWNYAKKHSERTCRLSMKKYIHNDLVKFDHPHPLKPQLSAHKYREIQYGSKVQKSMEEDTNPPLNVAGIKRVQGIVGALLYYGRAVANKLLVALNAIGSKQAAETEKTSQAIDQLLNYVATYPNDGTIHRSRDMILAAHSDAGFNNESKGRIRAGAHILLSENVPVPKWNGLILTITQIIKFVMSSAAEAELGALYVTAKSLVPIRLTLAEMGWKQPVMSIQTDNTAATGVFNSTIIPKKSKSMDLRFWWL